MELSSWVSLSIAIGYIILILLFAVAIIMQRRPVGASLAWLLLLFAVPFLGMLLYLILGSQFLEVRRNRYAHAIYPKYREWKHHLHQLFTEQSQKPSIEETRLYRFIENTMNMPALANNALEICTNSDEIIDRIIEDINQASVSIKMQFYIWWPEGRTQEVNAALLDAVKRGIKCQILVDAVGSRFFLQSDEAQTLSDAGIEITASLPVGPIRIFFERIDIRNHRKIIVIDEKTAWTGSFNLIDPRYFKQKEQLGQWVDAMLRIQGPAVYILNTLFLWDWEMETEESPKLTVPNPNNLLTAKGDNYIHILPSDPNMNKERLHQALLTTIYESQKEITIATPYFVPDDALFSALLSAAKRGVDVKIIIPKTIDSRLARFASRFYYQDLLESGAQIFLFNTGILHTKYVLVDQSTVLFGSVNMDVRSIWLNMELTLIIYNKGFAIKIHEITKDYLQNTVELTLSSWQQQRSFMKRFAENAAQLFSPLL